MENQIKEKAKELRGALSSLGKKLDAGEQSELLVWVIPGTLACAHRPLRHHPQFGGSGRDLPSDAAPAVLDWVRRIKGYGIRGIISLMHPKELRHYEQLNLGAENLIELYQKEGLYVRHIPWEDPAHRPAFERVSFADELARVRVEALRAFDELPKPVLLHCSAGIDRSSPVAAFIFALWGKGNNPTPNNPAPPAGGVEAARMDSEGMLPRRR